MSRFLLSSFPDTSRCLQMLSLPSAGVRVVEVSHSHRVCASGRASNTKTVHSTVNGEDSAGIPDAYTTLLETHCHGVASNQGRHAAYFDNFRFVVPETDHVVSGKSCMLRNAAVATFVSARMRLCGILYPTYALLRHVARSHLCFASSLDRLIRGFEAMGNIGGTLARNLLGMPGVRIVKTATWEIVCLASW